MDSKILLGGVVIGVGVLYYVYDSYQKARPAYHGGGGGAFSINLTEQRGIPTQFSTALDDPLYSIPPASQDDQIMANLPIPVASATDGICGVDTVEEWNYYLIKEGIEPLSDKETLSFKQDPSLLGRALSGRKTMAGCFPTTR